VTKRDNDFIRFSFERVFIDRSKKDIHSVKKPASTDQKSILEFGLGHENFTHVGQYYKYERV
jgi:hypothetical protein